MCVRIEQDLISGPHTSQQARDHVSEQLSRLLSSTPRADVTDDARLITSEFVTNALRAGAVSIRLGLELHHDTLKIEVHDEAPGVPRVRPADPSADTGRGLLIVAQIARAWGAVPQGAGKTVWATLDVPATLTRTLLCERVLGG
jgi:anti-sigma regulatory factor (Ser/Thr protein kinase)